MLGGTGDGALDPWSCFFFFEIRFTNWGEDFSLYLLISKFLISILSFPYEEFVTYFINSVFLAGFLLDLRFAKK